VRSSTPVCALHVPSIVGGDHTAVVPSTTTAAAVRGSGLVAEDGNRLPGVSRCTERSVPAPGKTYDVM